MEHDAAKEPARVDDRARHEDGEGHRAKKFGFPNPRNEDEEAGEDVHPHAAEQWLDAVEDLFALRVGNGPGIELDNRRAVSREGRLKFFGRSLAVSEGEKREGAPSRVRGAARLVG